MRRIGFVFAVLDHSAGELHEETRRSFKRSIRDLAKSDCSPSRSSSPSRNVRPSSPPKFARKSVERLPRTADTKTRPQPASQPPQPCRGPETDNSSSPKTSAECPSGIERDPTQTS